MVLDLKLAPFNESEFTSMYFEQRNHMTAKTVLNWRDYLQVAAEVINKHADKAAHGGLVYAKTTSNTRQRASFDDGLGFITALAIDIDHSVKSESVFLDLFESFKQRGITFHAQWRYADSTDEWKAHIIFPYAAPLRISTADFIFEFHKELCKSLIPRDIQTDKTVGRPEGVLFFVHSRTTEPIAKNMVHQTENALDGAALYAKWAAEKEIRRGIHLGPKKRVKSDYTQHKMSKRAAVLLEHCESFGWVESKGAWQIRCPTGHEDAAKNKTILYPDGKIVCMAEKCFGKHISHFINQMPTDAQSHFIEQKEILPESLQKLSVDQAHERLKRLLSSVKPVNANAVCAKITTGAGKTHAITAHLLDYSAPIVDDDGVEEPGLTSVLGTPTNALLREVEPRLKNIPYIKRVGVLAVLNDDGSPACKKHSEASALQKAGGNVHKLMCAHCEYKNDCPARTAVCVGSGALNLTNHALLPSVSLKLREKHKHPLVVWDESPSWFQMESIPIAELTWLLEQFDIEALTANQVSLAEHVGRVRLYSEKYRRVVKPLADFIRAVIYQKNLPENMPLMTGVAFSDHYRFLKTKIDVESALKQTSTEMDLEMTGWDALREAFRKGGLLAKVDAGYDKMTSQNKDRVVRTERLLKFFEVLCGTNSAFAHNKEEIFACALSPSADAFIENGGIVLDATANLQIIKSLRQDTVVEEISVKDAKNDNTRVFIEAAGLSRTSLKFDTQVLDMALGQIHKDIQKWDINKDAKIALFTHKPYLDYCEKNARFRFTSLHFGNTRGYDSFFQEGYNVFITLGDPIANLSALMMQWFVLHGELPQTDSKEWADYVSYTARSELAQAHGRARDPQLTKAKSGRILHIHFGRHVPDGWDRDNTNLDLLNSFG